MGDVVLTMATPGVLGTVVVPHHLGVVGVGERRVLGVQIGMDI